jgi:hypothetical protein
MDSSESTLIAINPVLADRVTEFEEWLRSVVVPAMDEHRPELKGRWRVLRATESDDEVVVFAFVCDGGTTQDWDLLPILEDALGPAGAERALATFRDMLQQDQQGWFFTPLHFDSA